MNVATRILSTLAVSLLMAGAAHAAPVKAERVTGGALDLPWTNGGDISNTLQPLTLDASHPAYANPSGDHTVGLALSSVAPDSGGLIVSTTSTDGLTDYSWEAWIFTGDGNTRRGIILRASPSDNAENFYMLVIESGLFQVRFRKLIGQTPTTLGTWLANTFPGGVPAVNQWHHMKVEAIGSNFRCWWDGYELTQGTPIVDTELASGDVGVYTFRFDLGQVPVYYDDLLLEDLSVTSVTPSTWGAVKKLYR